MSEKERKLRSYMGKNYLLWIAREMRLHLDEEKSHKLDELIVEFIIPWAEGREYDEAGAKQASREWKLSGYQKGGVNEAFWVIHGIMKTIRFKDYDHHMMNKCVNYANSVVPAYEGMQKRASQEVTRLYEEYGKKGL